MPIINDVEVEGCDYAILSKSRCPAKSMPYAKETSCIACKEHNTKLNFCKNNPNCYFKQLQRLKEENENLKYENEVLKIKYEAIKQINGSLMEGISKDVLKFSHEYIEKEQTKRLKKENKELKQALEEIKKLIKGHKVADETRLKSIITKIDEVLR